MRPRTPLQEKTPFAIDPEPLEGLMGAQAGLCIVSRAFRSLGLGQVCDTQVQTKRRDRGYTAGQHVESLVLLHAAGGDCMQDMERLRADGCLSKMLGYTLPGARCVADFLEAFHDPKSIAKARELATGQGLLAFIPDETQVLGGLQEVQEHLIRMAHKRTEKKTECGTVDEDATIIESNKRDAQWTYEGTRGYQPALAVWAETGLVLADEFRDGNVPAAFEPLNCAKAAFAALPESVREYAFRGDSACHESDLVNWLRNPERPDGPKGSILFAISARMSSDLLSATKAVREKQWVTFGKDSDGTLRQWAEVDFVPGEKSEKKNTIPLRYIGLRLLKAQGELFSDGNDRRHFAVLTNREEDGAWIINWHREKAGTIEHVHEDVKNGLGGGRLPSNKFGANAAWFRISCLAYNILRVIAKAWPEEDLKTAKAKRIRFTIITVAGRIVRDRRKISLRFAASREWIQNLIHAFEALPLQTRATG